VVLAVSREKPARDEQRERRSRLPLLDGRGGLRRPPAVAPLAAQLAEAEQRPERNASRSAAAPLISGRLHRPELTPATDDLGLSDMTAPRHPLTHGFAEAMPGASETSAGRPKGARDQRRHWLPLSEAKQTPLRPTFRATEGSR